MTNIVEIQKMLFTPEYDFLRNNARLGSNICMITLGGSHAYGTNIEGSDVDIRGIANNSADEILLRSDFEQVVNTNTDTTIYSFNKIIDLLTKMNPNTIEMLGCKPDHYLYLNDIGKLIVDNADLFISKKCVYTFGGYASQQLRRLDNKAARKVSEEDNEKHIVRRMNDTIDAIYVDTIKKGGSIKIYTDKSNIDERGYDIFADINLSHYPLRDYDGMFADLRNIIKDFDKTGHRNNNASSRGKIGKHQMHLVRLYLMVFDIFEHGKIITYREKDHDFLMSIRNGKYLDEHDQPTKEFMDIVAEYENKLHHYKENNNDIPKDPDYEKINKLVKSVNRSIIANSI